LRYGRRTGKLPSHLLQFSSDKKPVVVWNVTRRCNLRCIHCYSGSRDIPYEGELTTEEGKNLIDDLVDFGSPVILFSGGEPTLRPDICELAAYAVSRGMRAVISTNGTLINDEMASEFREIGLSYVGVSLDGLAEVNDRFRGAPGGFDAAMAGIEACRRHEIKVGLRLTLNKRNVNDISGIFDLIDQTDIPRICFYHLVYSGRAEKLAAEDLTHEESRRIVDFLIDRTAELHARGKKVEVLTVDNHCDGPYLYLRMLREDNPRAEAVLELLKMNGGNNSGNGIGCVSWNGDVYADQFWRDHSFGNILERPFSEIWTDLSNPLMAKLKNKKKFVKGRCGQCRFLDICAGNLRARAESVYKDPWAPDPACYLTDCEIGLE